MKKIYTDKMQTIKKIIAEGNDDNNRDRLMIEEEEELDA